MKRRSGSSPFQPEILELTSEHGWGKIIIYSGREIGPIISQQLRFNYKSTVGSLPNCHRAEIQVIEFNFDEEFPTFVANLMIVLDLTSDGQAKQFSAVENFPADDLLTCIIQSTDYAYNMIVAAHEAGGDHDRFLDIMDEWNSGNDDDDDEDDDEDEHDTIEHYSEDTGCVDGDEVGPEPYAEEYSTGEEASGKSVAGRYDPVDLRPKYPNGVEPRTAPLPSLLPLRPRKNTRSQPAQKMPEFRADKILADLREKLTKDQPKA